MTKTLIIIFFILTFTVPAGATQTYVMSGVVTDVSGKPSAGADVAVYLGPNVKKPADFISNRTGADGKYSLALPQGHYWAVAVLRKDGRKFGPLGLHDKHSGGAVELDAGPDEDMVYNFTVMALKDAALKARKRNKDLLEVSGRIMGPDGKPAALAYALADPGRKFKLIPRYLSAWTDNSGHYSLFLPPGHFYIGAAGHFPPKAGYLLKDGLTLKADRHNFNLSLRAGQK
ncbi:hypothetical protein MNBD_DELTA03-1138 [hydrothermal vent metagenome]|uniref:Carboxypeptidase regulatory-like domain-containing protein n=1 Tax=hydrothermal vent metagenome TaxID=652676 RepID=A0A3B0UY71_9ZZZZ